MAETSEILEKASSGDLAGADLSRANLKNQDLSGAKLAGANLARARLAGANLAGADLSGADLSGANVSGANLNGAKLAGARLGRASFDGSDLTGADFSGAEGDRAGFRKATGEGANFREAKIPGAAFSNAALVGPDFTGADLTDADAADMTVKGGRYAGATLSGGVYQNAIFEACDFAAIAGERADFSLATIRDGTFAGARLAEADYSNALLERTSFADADLTGARFNISDHLEVNLTGATLDRASFKSVSGYTEEEIGAFAERGARVDRFVIRRALRFVRRSRPAQAVLLAAVVALGFGVQAWLANPENWSFAKLDERGQEARDRGDYETARRYYQIVVRKYAANPLRVAQAMNAIASTALDQRKVSEARRLFQEVIDTFPDQDNALLTAEFGMAATYAEEGKFEEAIERYKAYAEKWKDFPQAADAHDRVARIYVRINEFEKAEEQYRLIIEKYAADPNIILRAEFDVANLFLENGRVREAVDRYRKIAEAYADRPDTASRAFAGVINGLVTMSKLDEAREVLARMRETYPDQTDNLVQAESQIANVEAVIGDPGKAEERFLAMLERLGGDSQARWVGSRLAQLYTNTGRPGMALELYDRLIDRFRDRPAERDDLKIEQAQVLILVDRVNDGVNALRAVANDAVETDQRRRATVQLANVLAQHRRYDEARPIFVELTELGKNDPATASQAFVGLGHIALETGRFDEAATQFERAIDVAHENGDKFQAFGALRRLWEEAKDPKKELQTLERIRETFRDEPNFESLIDVLFADYYRRAGDIDAAKEALRAGADTDNANQAAAALSTLVRLLTETGDLDGAKQVQDEINARFPNNTGAILDAQIARAQSLLARGDEDEGIALYEQVTQSGDAARSRHALLALMNHHAQKRDIGSARRYYDRLIENAPEASHEAVTARLTFASALRTAGLGDEALKHYQDMAESGFGKQVRAWALDGIAGIHVDRKQYGDAEALYRTIVEEFPGEMYARDRFRAHIGLATVYEAKRNYAEAEQEYEKASELVSDAESRGQARAALVRVVADSGDIARAEQMVDEFEKSASAHPSQIEQARLSVATAMSTQGRKDEALRRLESIIKEVDTPSALGQALTTMAHTYAQVGRIDDAVRSFERLETEFPGDPAVFETARFGKAQVYLGAGRLDRAAREYEAILKGDERPSVRLRAKAELAALRAREGRFDEARLAYEEILAEHADNLEAVAAANRGMGAILRTQGRYDEAIEVWRRNAGEKFEEGVRVEALSSIANLSTELGRFAEAQKAYEEIEAVSPGSRGLAANSKFGQAQVLRQNNQFEDAASLFAEAAKEAPDRQTRGNALIAVAQIQAQLGRKDVAHEQFNEIVESFAGVPSVVAQARFGRAELLRTDKRLDEAFALMDQVAQSAQEESERIQAMSAMAQIRLEQGRFDDAVADYERMLKAFEGNDSVRLDALGGMADVYRRQGKIERALATYRRVRAEAPDETRRLWADSAVARMRLERGEHDQAIRAYQAIVDEYGANKAARLDARMGIAEALKEQRKLGEAEKMFQAVVDEAPESPQAYWAMMGTAQIAGEKGAFDKAQAIYKEVGERFGQNAQSVADSKMNLANLLRSGNKNREALAAYQEILKEFPNTPYAGWSLGAIAQIHLGFGEYDAAREAYKRMMETFPAHPEFTEQARMGLAEVENQAGNREAALAAYREIVDKAQDPEAAMRARLAIARSLMAVEEYAEARKIFEEIAGAAKVEPSLKLQASLGVGETAMAGGDSRTARRVFEEVAREAGDRSEAGSALQLLGQALVNLGEFREVENVIREIKSRFPGDQNSVINVRLALVGKLREERRFDEAIAKLDPLIKEYEGQPQTAWALHAKAQILSHQRRTDDANAVYESLIEEYPNNLTSLIDAHLGIARNLHEGGRGDDALDRYRMVAEKWPDYPQTISALNQLAQLYQERGNDEALEDVLKRTLAMDAADANTKSNAAITLAGLYGRKHRIRDALAQYEMIYTRWPETNQAAWAMSSAARLLNENGEQAAAVKLLEDLIAKYPATHEAVVGAKAALAQIYER
ncbi:tetratricopeptide repeat protein [bacterium]|nr:tetratricopeptide repeat protein [bacterium]